MDKKRNFRARGGQRGKRRDGDVYFVANTRGLHHRLVGVLGKQFAAQMSNHRVAAPSVRVWLRLPSGLMV